MTVMSVETDVEALELRITSEFAAPVDRVWQVWADPRQLERWWGPPSHPATVIDHELTPGGKVTYFMTGPEGERYHGWWRVVSVDPPHGLVFEDGFADDGGEPDLDLPVSTTRVDLSASSQERTTMVITSAFGSLEAMQQVLEMGAAEGMSQALGQIDGILDGSGQD